MDSQTVDQNYARLQQQGQQTAVVDNHVRSTGQPGYQPQQGYQQPQYQGYQQPQYQQQGGMMGGGAGVMLQSFLGGGFGRAIVTGAGFGIGDDIINKIF